MAAITSAAIGAAGAIGGAMLSKKGGSAQQTQQMPAWMQAQYQKAQGYDTAAAARTASQAVAGFTPDQLAAMQKIRSSVGFLQPDMAAAQARAKQLSGGITGADIERFQNPYTNDVVNTTLNDIDRQRQIQLQGVNAQAENAGAWGGDRAEVARSLTNDSFDRTAASTAAGLRDQGFNTALSAAFNNQNAGLAGNSQLMDIINQRRNANTGDIGNLLASGGQQQNLQQQLDDWAIKRGQVAGQNLNPNAGGTKTYSESPPFLSGLAGGLQYGQQVGGQIGDLYNSIFNRVPALKDPNSVQILSPTG